MAQNFLLLEKEGSTKRIKFQVGDQLKFKVHNSDTIFEDQISAVFDSAVAFGNFQVPFSDIKQVWIRKERFWPNVVKGLAMLGGPAYFTLDIFNRSVNHDKPVLSQSAVKVLAASAAIVGVIHFTEKHWFRVGGKNRIRRLDISMN